MQIPVTLGTTTYSIPGRGDVDWGGSVQGWIVAANAAIVSTTSYSVKTLGGAKGDGVTNDSAAFQTALNANNYVVVPAGTYVITNGFNIPTNTTLELLPGAILLLGASITMNNVQRARLLGPHAGTGDETANTPATNLKWTGAAGGTIIQIGTATGSPIGCLVRGISVSANNVANVTGIQIGGTGFGAAWCRLENVWLSENFYGLDVGPGTQQCHFTGIYVRNNGGPTAGTEGIRIGVLRGPQAITTLWFTDGSVENYPTGFHIGSVGGDGNGVLGLRQGGALIGIRGFTVECSSTTNICAYKIENGGPIWI